MRFEPLHPDFGVEVLEYDLLDDRSPASIATLRRALDEHQLLLFRGGPHLSPEIQLEIATRFGTACEGGAGEMVSVLHNDDAGGRRQLQFHSDFTYTEDPLPIIALQAIVLPPGGTATAFANAAKAWERLDGELQARLAQLTVRHDHFTDVGGPTEFIADHPMRYAHPRTGRPILFITEHHARRIEGLSAEESDRLLQDLFARMYDPKGVYVHRWRLNDLLVWDNLALQHARPEEAAPERGVRAMQRVQVGTVGYTELVERAQRQKAERAASLAH